MAAGHVCTVMGYTAYEAIASRFQIPIIVTGFEPIDLLQGIYLCVKQLETGRAEVENQYARSVKRLGNQQAIAMIDQVFEVISLPWRGLAEIPESGLKLREKYANFDAQHRFSQHLCAHPSANSIEIPESPLCISGSILQGTHKPHECPSFGRACIPENPLGAPMVSSEGACSAYYQYYFRVTT